MTTQLQQDWNTARRVIFWVGAAATFIFSAFLIIAFGIVTPESWGAYLLIPIIGTFVAYLIAWFGHGIDGTRTLAIMLFIATVIFGFLWSSSILYLPGLIGLAMGTRHRLELEHAQRTSAQIM